MGGDLRRSFRLRHHHEDRGKFGILCNLWRSSHYVLKVRASFAVKSLLLPCMSRIKLDIPANLPYKTRIAVRVSDLNYADHLGNDAVLSMMHEARRRYLRNLGFEELDIDGIGTIMTDTGIVYKSEGFYGQMLTVEVGAGDFSSRGFDLYYRLSNEDTGKEVAIAKTGILCYDYSRKKVVSIPQVFIDAVGGES